MDFRRNPRQNQVVILTESDTNLTVCFKAIYCIKYYINKHDVTPLLKYCTEEIMQTSLSHPSQFLFKLLFCLFIALRSRVSSSLELHQN